MNPWIYAVIAAAVLLFAPSVVDTVQRWLVKREGATAERQITSRDVPLKPKRGRRYPSRRYADGGRQGHRRNGSLR